MTASLTFQHILTQIQDSNLNFQLQVSPSAAVISLKKSFVKDKSGVPLPRMRHLSDTSSKIEALEAELSSMHNEYDRLVAKNKEASKIIDTLEKCLNERDQRIKLLEASTLTAKAAAMKLNDVVIENKRNYVEEKKLIIKKYEDEIKSWKKELGDC